MRCKIALLVLAGVVWGGGAEGQLVPSDVDVSASIGVGTLAGAGVFRRDVFEIEGELTWRSSVVGNVKSSWRNAGYGFPTIFSSVGLKASRGRYEGVGGAGVFVQPIDRYRSLQSHVWTSFRTLLGPFWRMSLDMLWEPTHRWRRSSVVKVEFVFGGSVPR